MSSGGDLEPHKPQVTPKPERILDPTGPPEPPEEPPEKPLAPRAEPLVPRPDAPSPYEID